MSTKEAQYILYHCYAVASHLKIKLHIKMVTLIFMPSLAISCRQHSVFGLGLACFSNT